jgi:catechol 2,3-dioxygenase-like lactoylglutathione lyase family enzyme
MPAPQKLAHIVYRTGRLHEMKDWYCRVLNARVAFASDWIAFITYDDEHHRVAFVSVGDLDAERGNGPGIEHVAFTYASLSDLLKTYVALKEAGILPYWTINHGPTTSFYYRDPDENQIELQVENFPTMRALNDFFRSGLYRRNPIGVNIDPELLLERFRSGVPEEELLRPEGYVPPG